MRMPAFIVRASAACAMLLAGAVHAQDYPSRPVTLVVPVTAGSSIDGVSRLIGTELSKRLGQAVVVDNKPGASGNIGAALVAKAPADGHTLMITTSSLAMAPSLAKSLPWDPRTAFTPIAALFSGAMSVAVGAHVPVQNMQQLVALAKSRPGQLTYATPGNATPHHFGTHLLMQATGTELMHVPFKGTGPAITELMAGRIDVAYFSLGNLLEHHRSGKVRILATSTDRRLAQLPEVPTLRELGLQSAEINVWAGLFAPAGTPGPVVDRLRREMAEVMKNPQVKALLDAQNVVQMLPGTADQLASEYKADLERWPAVTQRMGIKAE